MSSKEPFRRLINQGYIQAFAYTDARGAYVPAAEVVERDGKFGSRRSGSAPGVRQDRQEPENSISPDEICSEGTARTRCGVYEMSMGPLEASRPWATKDVVSAHRFLQRVWRLVVDETTGGTRVADEDPDEATLKALHRAIDGVSDDYANLRNNTAAAKAHRYANPPLRKV